MKIKIMKKISKIEYEWIKIGRGHLGSKGPQPQARPHSPGFQRQEDEAP